MINYDYYAPRSLAEAVQLLAQNNGSARLLAGGTDLIIQLKDGRARPGVVVDTKHIPELNLLELANEGTLRVGAAVPLSKIVAFPAVAAKFTMLHQGCALIGSLQIRNRATMGGNICNAAPSADSAPALVCLGAKAVVASAKGKRKVGLENFFKGPGQTILAGDEILVEVEIPAAPAFSGGCYLRHTPRQEMDIAAAGVGAFIVRAAAGGPCQTVKIVLGAVAPTPLPVPDVAADLAGKELTESVIGTAAEKAAAAASPISDTRASADYRRELVKVLTRRTLQSAWEASTGKA